jgi:hypothetical protein
MQSQLRSEVTALGVSGCLQVAVLTGLAGLPWVIKPVYGFISDSIPLFGYR